MLRIAPTTVAVDDTSPGLILVSPATQTDVPVDTPIRLGANEIIDISASMLTVSPSIGDKPNIFYKGIDLGHGQFKFIYEIEPDGILEKNTNYTLTIKGAKDMAGNVMLGEQNLVFKTAATDALPEVVSTDPAASATGVVINKSVSALFSTKMDETSITSSTFTLTTSVNDPGVNGHIAYDSTTKTAVFDPLSSLAYGTVYTATITTGVTDINLNHMASDYFWNFTTVAEGSVVKPTASSWQPTGTAVDIAPTISVVFAKDMDASTINSTTFIVATSNPITGTVTYDQASKTATFTLDSDLAYSKTHNVTIKSNVTDTDGNAMAADHTWSFTTADPPDTTAPTIDSTSPAADVTDVDPGVTGAIDVTFSEDMSFSNVTTSDLWTVSDGTGTVSGTITQSGAVATFTPDVAFSYEKTYQVALSGAIADEAGNPLGSDYSWSFTTIVEPDSTPPTVSSVTPANSTTGVSLGTLVVITFSEPMDATTITNSNITLTLVGGAVTGTVSYDANTYKATFTPSAQLSADTVHTVTVSTSVTDIAGNALSSAFTSGFTTGAAPHVPSSDWNTLIWGIDVWAP